jgi:hypothetical protein
MPRVRWPRLRARAAETFWEMSPEELEVLVDLLDEIRDELMEQLDIFGQR